MRRLFWSGSDPKRLSSSYRCEQIRPLSKLIEGFDEVTSTITRNNCFLTRKACNALLRAHIHITGMPDARR